VPLNLTGFTVAGATAQTWVLQQGTKVHLLPEPPATSPTGQIALRADIGTVKLLETWIKAWVAGTAIPLSGELMGYDWKTEKARYTFKGGTIAALRFPTLDAASSAPLRFSIQLQGNVVAAPLTKQPLPSGMTTMQNQSPSSNFLMTMTNQDMRNVVRIDAIAMLAPGMFPIVTVTMRASPATTGLLALQKAGTAVASKIVCLAPNLSDALLTLAFNATVVSVGSAPAPVIRLRSTSNVMSTVPVRLKITKGELTLAAFVP